MARWRSAALPSRRGNGKMTVVNQSTTSGFIWWLTYLSFKDAYLEATFEVEDCSANDQYGLVVRAPDYEDGRGYYYTLTCGGQYDLRRWDKARFHPVAELSFQQRH